MKELQIVVLFTNGEEKTVTIEVPQDWEYQSSKYVPSLDTWAPQGETGVPLPKVSGDTSSH